MLAWGCLGALSEVSQPNTREAWGAAEIEMAKRGQEIP